MDVLNFGFYSLKGLGAKQFGANVGEQLFSTYIRSAFLALFRDKLRFEFPTLFSTLASPMLLKYIVTGCL